MAQKPNQSQNKGGRKNRPTAPPEMFHDPGIFSKPLKMKVRFASEMAFNAATELLADVETQVGHLAHFASNRLRYDKRENRVDAMHNYIDNQIERTLNPALLEERTNAVLKTLEPTGFDPDSIYEDEDETYDFIGRIYSPHGRRFLEILTQIDRYEALRTVAYLYGLIETKYNAREHYRYKRSLDKVSDLLKRTADRARKRRINPLVDSGDFWGRTREEMKAIEAQKAKKAQKVGESTPESGGESVAPEPVKPAAQGTRRSESSKSNTNDSAAPKAKTKAASKSSKAAATEIAETTEATTNSETSDAEPTPVASSG
ncbi:hypothetical protein [Thioalkalivibrio sp. ALE16]|uniref:hypothetical protein n=1 Tax=Thioalkalivibrio sp. ALE16 TaxID=1158172 RepID=UPI000375EF80|nr:hypothetical protein [Thioalkalivibrio sp. ALE16]